MAPAVARDMPVNLQILPLTELKPSPLNLRRHFDKAKLEELAASMANGRGILEPLLGRRRNGHVEIIAGARRLRAAIIAKLEDAPVVLKELTDAEVLETMVIENDAREDMTPLERAEGYRRLLKLGTLDVDKLAARIGRSRSWVYDVMKLNELIGPAKVLLEQGRITAGHAIPLARLTHEQQGRAIDPIQGGLFTRQSYLWDPANATATDKAGDVLDDMKPVSVREFQAWIDETFRFPANPDPELFPDTVGTIDAAIEAEEKVVYITYKHQVPPEVKGEGSGARIYGPMSWKRADRLGQTCDASVTGIIVIGPHRGEAFKVCIDKNCDVHWRKEKRQREKAKKTRAASGSTPASTESSQDRARREIEERQQKQQAFDAAAPAILTAIANKLKTVAIGKVVTAILEMENASELQEAEDLIGKGKTPEHALRLLLLMQLSNDCGFWNLDSFAKDVKALLGVDVKAILKKASAPQAEGVQTTGKTKPRGKAAKKR